MSIDIKAELETLKRRLEMIGGSEVIRGNSLSLADHPYSKGHSIGFRMGYAGAAGEIGKLLEKIKNG